jgi:hypothetical protein
MQPLVGQPQAPVGTLPKKSCLKTYGRFFGFSPSCHNRAMNNENTIANGTENTGPTECSSQTLVDSQGRDAALRRPGRRSAPTLPGSETPVEADETQTPQHGLPATRSRNGKIARLPLAIRQQLNQRLQNGEPGQDLIQWLNGLPEVQAVLAAQFNGQPIMQNNLSRWKTGGYVRWEAEQTAQEAAARLVEQAAGLQQAVKEGLADHMTLVLTAKMAVELERLDAFPDGEEKSKIWRQLIGSLALLRRGSLQGERILVEREKLGFRRELHQRDREAEFWQWIEKEEYRDQILEKLLTPEQNDAEIERRNEEKRRRVKEILGIR